MQQLQGMDSVFIWNELPNSPMNMCLLLVYDASGVRTTMQFSELRDHVRGQMHLEPTFRQRLVRVPFDLDRPYWIEDADFDLDRHVHHVTAKPDWDGLYAEAVRVVMEPFDFDHPLWELWFVDGLDDLGGSMRRPFALLLKLHHAAVDGMSGLELMVALSDTEPDAGPATPDVQARASKRPSPFELLTRAVAHNMAAPSHLPALMTRTALGMARLQARSLLRETAVPAAMDTPRTRFNRRVSAGRVLDFRSFDLTEVRRIKNAIPKASINDFLMAVIGGAMREYLSTKAELPANSLTAMVPISIRTEEEIGQKGNRIATIFVRLGTDTDDPLARIAYVRDARAQAKGNVDALGPESMEQWMRHVPGALMSQAMRVSSMLRVADYSPAMFNTAVTNMPGPPHPLYLRGARLTYIVPVSFLMDYMSLVHAAVSYDGKLIVSITADSEALPDPAFYARCLDNSYRATANSVSGQRGTETQG